MTEAEMERLAGWVCSALRRHDDAEALTHLGQQVRSLCERFPVPGLSVWPAYDTEAGQYSGSEERRIREVREPAHEISTAV
jgi:hypothetical protein